MVFAIASSFSSLILSVICSSKSSWKGGPSSISNFGPTSGGGGKKGKNSLSPERRASDGMNGKSVGKGKGEDSHSRRSLSPPEPLIRQLH